MPTNTGRQRRDEVNTRGQPGDEQLPLVQLLRRSRQAPEVARQPEQQCQRQHGQQAEAAIQPVPHDPCAGSGGLILQATAWPP